MRKMELTFLMAVRLSVYAPILPFLIPTCGTMGDFFSALLKAFRSSALFGASTGLNLLNSRLPALHFAGPQGPWLWLSSLLSPSDGLAFSFGRNTVFWATAANFMAPAMSVRPPRVRTHSFSPFTCRIYPLGFRVVMGLRSVW